MDKDKRIEMLEGTLLDTEKILFDPIIEVALRHFMKVKKDTAHICQDTINKRRILCEARRKRPGKLV